MPRVGLYWSKMVKQSILVNIAKMIKQGGIIENWTEIKLLNN